MSSGIALAEFVAGHDFVAVVCHSNPDPDTLASAMALRRSPATRASTRSTDCTAAPSPTSGTGRS